MMEVCTPADIWIAMTGAFAAGGFLVLAVLVVPGRTRSVEKEPVLDFLDRNTRHPAFTARMDAARHGTAERVPRGEPGAGRFR